MAVDFVRSLRGHPVRPPASGIARRISLWQRLHIDPWLLAMLLLLMVSGLAVLYSASGENMRVVTAQAIRFGVAWTVMLVLAQFSPATLMRWRCPPT